MPNCHSHPHLSSDAEANPLKILFTEATSLSARQSLYALGKNHIVDVMDPDPMSQCRFSSLVRRWVRSPSYAHAPEAFLDALVSQLSREDYDVLMPTHEQVVFLSRFHHVLSDVVGIALPDFEAMQQMQNKAEFMKLLGKLGLPRPETTYFRTSEELLRHDQFPCYVKLAHSTAGCGVHFVQSADELKSLTKRLAALGTFDSGTESVIQLPAKGVQSTVQAVFEHGRMVGAHLFEARRLGVGGMSPARVSATHSIVFEHVKAMGQHLNWHGATFIDYFFDHETGRPEYIEANPRIGETVNAWLCGENLPEKLARVSVGETLPDFVIPKAPRDDVDGLRTQSLYMILISDAHDGCGRWHLLKHLTAYLFGRGLYRNSQDELTRFRDDTLSVLPAFWIALQLLLLPSRSKQIVQSTIDNYSLPESSLERLVSLPVKSLQDKLQAAQTVK